MVMTLLCRGQILQHLPLWEAEAEVPVEIKEVVAMEVAAAELEVVLHKIMEVSEQQDKVLMVGANKIMAHKELVVVERNQLELQITHPGFLHWEVMDWNHQLLEQLITTAAAAAAAKVLELGLVAQAAVAMAEVGIIAVLMELQTLAAAAAVKVLMVVKAHIRWEEMEEVVFLF
jgi:hypothetical protein